MVRRASSKRTLPVQDSRVVRSNNCKPRRYSRLLDDPGPGRLPICKPAATRAKCGPAKADETVKVAQFHGLFHPSVAQLPRAACTSPFQVGWRRWLTICSGAPPSAAASPALAARVHICNNSTKPPAAAPIRAMARFRRLGLARQGQ